MEIDFDAKRLTFTEEEISDRRNFFDTDNEVFSSLLSVMAYPNDSAKQSLYLIGLRAENIKEKTEQTSKDEHDAFLKSEPDLLFALYDSETEGLKAYKAAQYSRKKGNTGSLFVRGIAAGNILRHLVLGCMNLEESYKCAIEDFQNIEAPVKVSKSWMQCHAWEKYKNVSHMWAAYIICGKMPAENRNVYLLTFLLLALKLRYCLIESTDPNKPAKPFRIKDPSNVWMLTDHNKKPFALNHVSSLLKP